MDFRIICVWPQAKLVVVAQEQQLAEVAEIRGDMVKAEWGQQIRNYVFHPYKMVRYRGIAHRVLSYGVAHASVPLRVEPCSMNCIPCAGALKYMSNSRNCSDEDVIFPSEFEGFITECCREMRLSKSSLRFILDALTSRPSLRLCMVTTLDPKCLCV